MPIRHRPASRLCAALLAALVGACSAASAGRSASLPDPALDPPPANPGEQVAVLAGGCFWGMQAVFEHVKGVRRVWAGYSGGDAATASYERVSDGDTGHAESVKILYDPRQVSYGQLLKVFFAVAHDPTQLNRQGPDAGTQYRSAIFYADGAQRRVAAAYIAQLGAAHAFDAPVVTQLAPLKAFYVAEAYHQDYARRHPDDSYIVYNDAPKVARLQRLLPALYRPEREVVRVELH
ncbi:peptide-methionine (S)-S-oxide reductase MsrA [Fulvimonas soli]|jgi:peptide-methionine (S)-S-oxide reductase|uniref:Peptide methionine sulfoxide reductase MsrA n=1 Tax=Fulvimonas soli TaxID=155197 RepID=A0A316HV66_9GAMM|nr:peptide-methionine (S)-S-oxide reductase MsrA [Fulvimonas soli]PWK85323.1 peptide-methionine (S)-S-oxide reductase [Fulvimonas soli]TNY27373.1 peptide-methionine (S)-S-oxide reductase [Fulvimonas soli]